VERSMFHLRPTLVFTSHSTSPLILPSMFF
jgi:hypothetical protein